MMCGDFGYTYIFQRTKDTCFRRAFTVVSAVKKILWNHKRPTPHHQWWYHTIAIRYTTSTTMADTNPAETLPGSVPHFIIFFLPNLWGFLLAFLFEAVQLEDKIGSWMPPSAHPHALFGLSLFVLFNVGSYLSGCVVCARLEYNVKLPNLYAQKSENKHAVLFNCVQRRHQNFLEGLPVFVGGSILCL